MLKNFRFLARLPIGTIPVLVLLAAGSAARLAAQSVYATPYTFSLLAGQGISGSTDGAATVAQFHEPYGVAVDSSGNVYVADRNNDTIRKITSSGTVSTLAGTPTLSGTTDGAGTVAQFSMPSGLAVDSSGNVYVADTSNNLIRKIGPGGNVTTLAGSTVGDTDGTGTAALFNQPIGICVDSSGNLYVTDSQNNTIRKVTPAGVVTTIAGTAGSSGSTDAVGVNARFQTPNGIAIDSAGNLYIADTGNNTIRMMATSGAVTTLAGTAGTSGYLDATGASARFNAPRGIAVDGGGNIFVADAQNNLIRRISSTQVVTTVAGKQGNFASLEGTGENALFDVPMGVAVDATGNLYVTEELGNRVDKGAAATAVAPALTLQPVSQTVATGSTVVFQAQATGTPAPAFQWYLNGTALSDGAGVSGATDTTLVLTGTTAASAGTYTATVTNASGTATTSPAALTFIAGALPGRLIDVSCRSQVGVGANILIMGFAVGGAGTSGSEPLLIRASGPALENFSVTGLLPDPELQVYSGSSLLGSDSGWGGSAAISAAAAAVGAFAWTQPASADSALIESLSAGPYTAQVLGQSGDTGVALAEVYDATVSYSAASPRLVNVSARTQVGTGSGVLIAGFVVGGSTSKTFLIRASGPALSAFDVPGVLPDPELQLYSGGTLLETNNGWGGDAAISNAAASVGAFAWSSAASHDSAIIITLAPGTYTAEVSGATGDTGVALVEVYEIP